MNTTLKRSITGALFGILFFGALFFAPAIFSLMLALILAIILVIEWPQLFSIKQCAFWLITPFYPILPFILLIILNQTQDHRHILWALFMLVFTFDTCSYFSGILFGTHKIAPRISPGKTWEGFIGGYLGTLGALLIFLHITANEKPILFSILFTLVLCALALAGDFFESSLKRRVGLKDSGNLLPGHGGFLDRFDGVLFVTYLFYIMRNFLSEVF